MKRPLPPLPPGVTFEGDPDLEPETYEVEDGGHKLAVVRARYRVHGLEVEVGWTTGHPMGGFASPDRLDVRFDSHAYGTASDPAEFSRSFEGINTSFLRAIPLAHAQALMRGVYERLSVQRARDDITPLPQRIESERDYVHAAAAYVSLARGRSVEPIRRLCEWTGESSDTWSARLRRARSKGILLGRGQEAEIAPQYLAVVSEIYSSIAKTKGL